MAETRTSPRQGSSSVRVAKSTAKSMTSDKKALASSAVKATLNDKGGKGRVRRVTQEVGKQKASVAVAKAAQSKGVPVAGLDAALANPTSVKAWASTAARTAVAAGLTYVGLGAFGGKVEELIHRIGYKRIAICLAVLMSVQAVCALVFLMFSAAIATEVIAKPMGVVSSILRHIPGLSNEEDEEALKDMPSNLCRAVPEPRPHSDPSSPPDTDAVTAPVTPSVTEGDTTEGTEPVSGHESPAGGFTPPRAIDEQGHITEDARDLMRQVPNGADPLYTESWMLYVLSHPKDDPYVQWDAFRPMFAASYHYVESKKKPNKQQVSTSPGEPLPPLKRGNRVNETPTPLEIVMHIDQGTYYDPFTLAASTMTASLIMEDDGFLTITSPDQESAVIGRMQAVCGAN